MFKRRKLLSLCCALILLISVLTPLAHADDAEDLPKYVSLPDTVFKVDSVVVDEGQSVDLVVSVENNHNICGFNITLDFDVSAFTVTSTVKRGTFASKGTISSNYDLVNSGENSVLTINYYSSSNPSSIDGTLCVINLKAKEAKVAGTYPITLTYDVKNTIQWSDAAANNGRFPMIQDAQCVGGQIEVKHVWDEGVKVPSVTIPDPAVIDTLYTCKVCGETYREPGYDPHHWEVTQTVNATCTENGRIDYKCTDCTLTRSEVIPATGHKFGDWTSDNANTHSRRCTVCNTAESGNHELVTTEEPPTCTEAGRIVHTCTICGYARAEQGAAATGHHYEEVVVAPGCTEPGRIDHVCSACGDTYSDPGAPATGHHFGAWTKYVRIVDFQTVTDPEVHRRRCPDCGTLEYAEHHLVASPEVAATCTEAGYITYTCSDCGYSFKQETAPAAGHKYDAVHTAPTCTAPGFSVYTCTVCGRTYRETGDPALGHDFTPWKSTGTVNHQHSCSRCGLVESQRHHLETTEVAATCTEAGNRHYSCADCDFVLDVPLQALGHDFSAWTDNGENHTRTCARCNLTESAPHNIESVETAPTCTEAGFTVNTCKDCGKTETVPGAAALGHDYGAWVDDGEANHKHTCSRCGATETAAHRFTVTETAPTCTAAGSKVSVCSDCGKTVTESIPAAGHKYVAVETAPTCTEAGFIFYTCSVCGDTYRVAGAPATGHDFGAWTDDGDNHVRKCQKCGAVETAAHSFTVTETAATCTEAGSKVSVCDVCGKKVTEAIPAAGHKYVAVVTDPTCTEAGFTTYTCSVCGDTYKENGAAALGHNFGAWVDDGEANHKHTCSRCGEAETAAHTFNVVTVEPTETENGSKTSTCTVCGRVVTEVIPALGHTHNYVAVETAPTCTAAGFTTYTCSGCGNSYKVDGAPALGHDFSAWTDAGDTSHKRTCSRCNEAEIEAHSFKVTETAPTCTAAGSKVSVCDVCGKTVTESIPAAGHKYESVVTAPTCTEGGYTTHTCSVCGDTYTDAATPATGHSFGAWTSVNSETHTRKCANCDVTETVQHNFTVTEVPATPDENGSKTYTCSDCGFTKTEVIPATGHNYVAVETAPTCTADGYITYTCSDCGASYVNPGAPALGHAFGEWTNGGEAGHSHTCSRCGEVETVAHNYVETVVAPTKTEGGYTLHECADCGGSYKDNFTDPLPSYIKGDVNMDGQVTNADLILVARYIVDLEEFTPLQFEIADMDSNGQVINSDLITIARIIVGLE